MKDKLRILYMGHLGSGIGDYRCWRPAAALRRAGHKVTSNEAEHGFFSEFMYNKIDINEWMRQVAPHHDVIHMTYTSVDWHVMYAATLRNMVMELEGRGLPIILDCDDDVHNVPPYNTSFKSYTRTAVERKVVLMGMHIADAVTVSTAPLLDVLKEDSRVIHHLPNCCNPDDWCNPVDPSRGDDKSIRMMFTGGQGHLSDLAQVREPVERAMRTLDGTNGKPLLRLLFMGCAPDWATQWMLDRSDASANRAFYIQPSLVPTYRACLQWLKPDILYAPIEHNLFNFSKSHIKAYDAAFSGAAFLCSDYETYGLVPNEAAIKVNTPTQWYESICALAEDASLRHRLNNRLKEWAVDKYHINNHTYKWEAVYQDALTRPVVTSLQDVVRPMREHPHANSSSRPLVNGCPSPHE